jgi:RND family efflux transporter MFP subunit
MHPAYTSDKPGIAPDCGMKLEPVYADEAAAGAAPTAESMPPGTVRISPEKQQLIGVRFGEVNVMPLERTIRTVGKIAYDETRVAHVHTKYEGWIDQVTANFTGQFVKKGQPLLTIYSPDLVAAEDEFLLAAKARNYLAGSPIQEVSAGSDSLYQASRRKLQLWDITDDQVREIERQNAPIKNMTLFSPLTGYLLTRNAFPNQRVTPETELYSIVDLSTVWVIADVYEYEADAIHLGQAVRITLTYAPGRVLSGRVSYIYPQLDNAARTLRVRADLANPGMLLKPDMFANVEFVVDYGRRLAVPEEAVMNSGLATTVFLDRGDGYLEPRTVELGDKVGTYYIVTKGLKAGDRVVTSGNFLVDSESRLKSAEAGMTGMPGMSGGQAGGGKAPKAPAAKPTAPAPMEMPGMQMGPKKQPAPQPPPGKTGAPPRGQRP